jgi:thiamine-phosphate pyrophosphorylase
MITCYITDRRRADIVECARRAIRQGVDFIQVREKDLEARDLLEYVEAILALTRESRTRVLVNDRLDVALAAGADGVHLPSDGLPARLVRPLIGLVGVSAHTVDEAREAERGGADFVIFGPVFDTPGKTAVGLAPLGECCRALGIPVLAVGGLTAANAPRATDVGAAGIAAIRMFQEPG